MAFAAAGKEGTTKFDLGLSIRKLSNIGFFTRIDDIKIKEIPIPLQAIPFHLSQNILVNYPDSTVSHTLSVSARNLGFGCQINNRVKLLKTSLKLQKLDCVLDSKSEADIIPDINWNAALSLEGSTGDINYKSSDLVAELNGSDVKWTLGIPQFNMPGVKVEDLKSNGSVLIKENFADLDIESGVGQVVSDIGLPVEVRDIQNKVQLEGNLVEPWNSLPSLELHVNDIEAPQLKTSLTSSTKTNFVDGMQSLHSTTSIEDLLAVDVKIAVPDTLDQVSGDIALNIDSLKNSWKAYKGFLIPRIPVSVIPKKLEGKISSETQFSLVHDLKNINPDSIVDDIELRSISNLDRINVEIPGIGVEVQSLSNRASLSIKESDLSLDNRTIIEKVLKKGNAPSKQRILKTTST